MKDVDVLISGIDFKTKKLIERYNKQKTENENLINKYNELTKIIEENKYRISYLEEKNKTLKFTKLLELGKGSVNVKQEINELTREIDKCISLLNK